MTNVLFAPNVLNTDRPFIAPKLLLSLAALPFLSGIVAVQASMQALKELGKTSEEVFRGDRLPPLHPPDPTVE